MTDQHLIFSLVPSSTPPPPPPHSPTPLGALVSLQTGDDRMNAVLAPYQQAIEALCRQYHVRRLELFGSAAAGDDRPGESDIDFLVEFEPLPYGASFDTYFGLRQALEDLFKRP